MSLSSVIIGILLIMYAIGIAVHMITDALSYWDGYEDGRKDMMNGIDRRKEMDND